MGTCMSVSRDRNGDNKQVILPDEVNRLLDRWAIGQVIFIRKKFLQCKIHNKPEIDLVGFRCLYTDLDQALPLSMVSLMFKTFDLRRCGSLTFRELCVGIASSCLSSWETRMKFIYNVFSGDYGLEGLRSDQVYRMLVGIVLSVRYAIRHGDYSVNFGESLVTPNPHLTVVGENTPPSASGLDRLQSCVSAIQSEVYSTTQDNHSSSDKKNLTATSLFSLNLSNEERTWVEEQKGVLISKGSDQVDFEKTFLHWTCMNSNFVYKFLDLLEVLPSPDREKRICLNILRQSHLDAGSTWYVVSYKWMQLWKSYVHWTEADSVGTIWNHSIGSPSSTHHGQNYAMGDAAGFGVFHTLSITDALSCTSTIIQQRMSERPLAINNGDLEGELKGALRANLVEHHDFLLVPEEMWKHLIDWYGGGVAFPRKVTTFKTRKLSSYMSSSLRHIPNTTIELYPPLILVILCGPDGRPVRHFTKRFFVSRSDSCHDLMNQLNKKLLNRDNTCNIRLWHRANGETWELIESDDPRCIDDFVDSITTDAGTFMVETRHCSTDSWPRDMVPPLFINSQGKPADDSALRELQVGDRVDARNTINGVWCKATVVDVSDESEIVKVHFDNEPYKFDAWLSCDSDEIAPVGTYDGQVCTTKSVFIEPQDSISHAGNASCLVRPCGSQYKESNQARGELKRHREKGQRSTTSSSLKVLGGATGLENIGNTCFMNASLQCLSRTPMLREYFLTNEFQKHLKDEAKVAGEFASLLTSMWANGTISSEFPKTAAYAPRKFKKALDKYAPRFAGYDHQDAHELLAVLLDGLHEDLNRGTRSSPTVKNEVGNQDDQPNLMDTDLGEIQWKKHCSTHASIVADLFDGQQRVETRCLTCGYRSVSFEAFRYVMLPVPVTDTRQMTVYFMPLASADRPRPRLVRLTSVVNKNAHIQDMLAVLSGTHQSLTQQYKVNWDDGIVLAEVYMSRIHRFVDVSAHVSEFRQDDLLYIFQVSSDVGIPGIRSNQVAPTQEIADYGAAGFAGHIELNSSSTSQCFAQIINRREIVNKRRYRRTGTFRELFGIPSLIAINPLWTEEYLYSIVKLHLQRFQLVDGKQSNFPGYVLRMIGPDGTSCSLCGKSSCDGCVIQPNSPKKLQFKGGWLYLGVDWQHSSQCYDERAEVPDVLYTTDIVAPSHIVNAGGELLDFNRKSTDSTSRPVTHSGGSKKPIPIYSIYHSMDAYTGTEPLLGDNQWYCEKCKKKSDAERKICWWVLPDVLVVLLKRFQYTSTGFEKVCAAVDFPIHDLTLKTAIPGGGALEHYELYGVVNHYGTLSSGHYTALCQDPDSTTDWFQINDHHVFPVSLDALPQHISNSAKSCYVLFYKRKGARSSNLINYGGVDSAEELR